MTLLLRKQRAQASIEGREPFDGQPKWLWFLQYIPGTPQGGPIPPPNQGMADSLDEAKAAFVNRYDEVWRN
jgi:hypothetical protein